MALSAADTQAAIASANRIGANPRDYLAVMSFESGGTFSPSQYGGTGGRHLGIIQFGPSEAAKYGANPGQTFQEQLPAVERYLTDRGFKPGMGAADLYSTINAGRPGLYNASDAANGGTWGSVSDKVNYQMGGHYATADKLIASSGQGSEGTTSVAGDGSLPGDGSNGPLVIRVRPNNQPVPEDSKAGTGSGGQGGLGNGLSGLAGTALGAGGSIPGAILALGSKTATAGQTVGADVKSSAAQLAGAAKTMSSDTGAIAAGVQAFTGDIFVRGAVIALALIFIAFGLSYFGRGGSVSPVAVARVIKSPIKTVRKII